MKWKWRKDRRSERNLCNCVKKPEKNSGLQRGLNPWPRDTGSMLYQPSYEATDVGSRSIVGSYVLVKEMSVNDDTREKRSAHACLPCFLREFASVFPNRNYTRYQNKLDSGREIQKSKLHTQKISLEFHEHKVY